MNRLGGTTKRIVRLEESYSLNIGFVAHEDLVQGQLVKLTTDGVSAYNEASDSAYYPIGYVTVGGKKGEEVTVSTPFQADVTGLASGTVTIGKALKTTGAGKKDGVTYTKYEDNDSGTKVAVALGSATNDQLVRVGVLRVFV